MPNTERKYSDLTLEEKVKKHIVACKDEMSRYATLCKTLDDAYVPPSRMATSGAWDTHVYDRVRGQAHVSVPIVYVTVNVKSNILGMRGPKFNLRPLDRRDEKQRGDAEFIETILDKLYVDENCEEAHLNLCRNLSLYGRAFIEDGDDFTHNIDQQANVWVSWKRIGEPQAFSFVELVSPTEAMNMGWDGLTENTPLRVNWPIYGGYSHDDPLGAIAHNWNNRDRTLVDNSIPVMHFYSQNTPKSVVRYSLIINGQIVKDEKSLGRKTWPLTMIETEHVPGSTVGVGDAEPVLDIQAELSERLSAWSEAVRRTIKDQWKAWGLNHLTPRHIPGSGQVWEMTDKAEEDIEPLKFITNDVGILQYIEQIWGVYRRISGIPSEVEAESLSHTSGYAMNVKYQSLIINLSARKIRMKRGWMKWAMNKFETIKRLYPEYAYLIDDAQFILEVDWEEITPADVAAETTRLAQAIQAKITSPYTAMEQLQLVPEDEIRLMQEFWVDPALNPQGAMAAAQAAMMAQQVQQQAQQGAQAPVDQSQPSGGGAGDLLGQAQNKAVQGVADTKSPIGGSRQGMPGVMQRAV